MPTLQTREEVSVVTRGPKLAKQPNNRKIVAHKEKKRLHW
jgi:hypothetical protein